MPRTNGASEKIRKAAVKAVLSGQKQAHVASVFGVWPTAVCNWMRLYRKGGFAALKGTVSSGRPPKLDRTQRERLSELLRRGAIAAGFSNELWTGKRVAWLVKKEFGIGYHHQYVPTLLRELGFSLQKPARVARERDEKKIRAWVTRTWPAIKKKPR
jgi:transposase